MSKGWTMQLRHFYTYDGGGLFLWIFSNHLDILIAVKLSHYDDLSVQIEVKASFQFQTGSF